MTGKDSKVRLGYSYCIVVKETGQTREHFLFNEIMETWLGRKMGVRRGQAKPGFL